MDFIVRRSDLLVVGLAILGSACGPSPAAPTAPPAVSLQGLGSSSGENVAYASRAVAAPEGFVPKFRVDPGPGDDGVIRGDETIEVEFDLCGSSNADGKTHFLFDWSFDHVADVVGSGEACRQTHTYRVQASVQGGKEQTLRTNVCVTSGDPRSGGPDVFFSCREYTIGLKAAPGQPTVQDACGVFFSGGYTICVNPASRIIRQDAGNDGSFEQTWILNHDTNPGAGVCPAGTIYNTEIAIQQFIEPAFYAWILDLGFGHYNDLCIFI